MHCVFRFFDSVPSHASVALRVLRTTAYRPMKMDLKVTF